MMWVYTGALLDINLDGAIAENTLSAQTKVIAAVQQGYYTVL